MLRNETRCAVAHGGQRGAGGAAFQRGRKAPSIKESQNPSGLPHWHANKVLWSMFSPVPGDGFLAKCFHCFHVSQKPFSGHSQWVRNMTRQSMEGIQWKAEMEARQMTGGNQSAHSLHITSTLIWNQAIGLWGVIFYWEFPSFVSVF